MAQALRKGYPVRVGNTRMAVGHLRSVLFIEGREGLEEWPAEMHDLFHDYRGGG